MKFRVDGPSSDELSTKPSLVLEMQRKFCDMFGGRDFSKKASKLEASSERHVFKRTSQKKVVKQHSVAHGKRVREKQLSSLTAASPNAEEHQKLEAVAASSKVDRKTARQATLASQLQRHVFKKKKALSEDAKPFCSESNEPLAKKHRLWKQAADLKVEALQKIQTRDLSINAVTEQVLHKKEVRLFVCGVVDQESSNILSTLGVASTPWNGSSDNFECAVTAKELLWYCEGIIFKNVVWPGENLTELAMTTRLLGGGVVNAEWAKLCAERGKVYKPALWLKRGLD